MTHRDLQELDPQQLAATLRPHFPHLAASDTAISETRGGRQAALALLARVEPQAYERSRNFLTGDVTRLSAYLRHGVLTLAEVRDAALGRVRDPAQAGKLINEFAWRDYWQRLYAQIGEGVWQDREAWKTGFRAADYSAQLPADVAGGTTTLVCIDSFAQQLQTTGYLHNHARMWFAAYLVHWRRINWRAGAAWFLEHLLDGDPASNNLSWQWVASTFSSKPYIFNRENLERYTAGVYCKQCPHARAHTCPLDRDYETLSETLFPRLNQQAATSLPDPPRPFAPTPPAKRTGPATGEPLLWVHTDSLNPASPMFNQHPKSTSIFVWDQDWLTQEKITLKRIVFLAECLREMPPSLALANGDLATEVLAAARAARAGHVLVQRTPDPRLLAAAAKIERELPVVWYDPPPFAEASRGFDLKRFSRYWQRAQPSAMQPTRDHP